MKSRYGQNWRAHSDTGRHGAQAGQALAEFLVTAVVLVPLFLLMPMIGKYQDLAHATMMASRYVAFDATSFGNSDGFNPWKSPATLAAEVRRRFFSNTTAPVKTGDEAGDFDANRNLFWRDPYGHPLIAQFSDIGVSFGNGAASQAGGFSAGSGADGAPFNRVPLASASTIGLQARGVYSASVNVPLANLPAGLKLIRPFDTINLSVERSTSLLFDPWSSPTTAKTEARVGRLAPVNAAVAALAPAIQATLLAVELDSSPGSTKTMPGGRVVQTATRVAAPQIGNLDVWRDEVPADRLIPAP
jgi:hypothetical protein